MYKRSFTYTEWLYIYISYNILQIFDVIISKHQDILNRLAGFYKLLQSCHVAYIVLTVTVIILTSLKWWGHFLYALSKERAYSLMTTIRKIRRAYDQFHTRKDGLRDTNYRKT